MAITRRILPVTAVALASVVTAHAQTPVDVGGTFQQIGQAANAWIPAIMHEAAFLFYVLATLDFAWGAPSFLRESDFNGLFLSLIKKLLVISFFYAVLINGQVWIPAIVNSFAQLGATAAGVPLAQNPSDIMTQGIQIVSDLFTKVSATDLLTQPGGAITTILAACIVLASYIIITLHYVVTKLEAIIVMSAGYIFLGFGGSLAFGTVKLQRSHTDRHGMAVLICCLLLPSRYIVPDFVTATSPSSCTTAEVITFRLSG